MIMTTREQTVAKMTAFAARQSLAQLCEALTLLDAKADRDDVERVTRSVLIDVICNKCPAANTAFDAWAGSDGSTDGRTAVQVITAAVRAA
jgi:hypothetical protein